MRDFANPVKKLPDFLGRAEKSRASLENYLSIGYTVIA